jgi:integrase
VSTGCREKVEALAVAHRLERLARESRPATPCEGVPPSQADELLEAGLAFIQAAKSGKLNADRAREFIDRISKASGEGALHRETFRTFSETWLAGVRLSKSAATVAKYSGTLKRFVETLGPKADQPLDAITSRDVERFRDARIAKVGATTAKHDLTVVGSIFNKARRAGLVLRNVCEAVDRPPPQSREREPFNAEEIAKLLAVASPDWKTAILLGALAGLRLTDACNLSWENVDLENKLLRFRARKTKRNETLPVHQAIVAHLQPFSGPQKGPLTPSLYGLKTGGLDGLSEQFAAIMAKARIDAKKQSALDGKGRSFSARSFHSLRHSFNSELLNAGVPQELRMKLSGHSSREINSTYSHAELQTLRAAVGLIPSVRTHSKRQ